MQDHLSSPSPSRENHFDINTLTLLLERKRNEPTWSINSRESTPAVLFDPRSVSGLEYWRGTALMFEQSIRSFDRQTDYRRTIETPSYWEIEANHLEKEFWALQRSRGKKRTEGQSEPASSLVTHDSQGKEGFKAHDEEISSRSRPQQGKTRIKKPMTQSNRQQGNIGIKKQDGPISSRLRNRKSGAAYCNQNMRVTRRDRRERSPPEHRTQRRRRKRSDE